jgi:tRNA (guanine-N7-)-methyltransferase
MKPKKLKFPFSWESRSPLLLDDVLYVPRYYEQHDEWSKESLNLRLSSFESISIEYCSGNGTWIAEKALENPSILWIAVEKRFDRVQKIWAKKHNLLIPNLLIVCGDALVFTKHYLKSQLVDQIFINFPDPWPKAKHAKNRVIREPFVKEMHRISKLGAETVLVTDDATYSEQVSLEMLRDDIWEASYPSPFYVTEWPGYGSSFFDSLWRERGREIRYMKFKK